MKGVGRWLGASLLISAACSGSSSATADHACTPGVAQQCFGPGACTGAQSCLSDGSEFGPCDCAGSSPGLDANTPSPRPDATSPSGGANVDASMDASVSASIDGSMHTSVDAAEGEVGHAETDGGVIADAPATVPESGPTPQPFAGEAAHPSAPQLVYSAGPLLTAPKIVTVTFAGDPMVTDLEAFGASVTSSSWWDTVRPGYCSPQGRTCVGDGPAGVAVRLTSAPASEYTDFSTGPSSLDVWLTRAISTNLLPPPDSNTVYVIYFPKTTKITVDYGASCDSSGFDGYHTVMSYGSARVFYAVVMECDPQLPAAPSIPTDTRLQSTTLTASHEIAESATDPIPPSGYALDETDPNNWVWLSATFGGEAGDMCVDFLGMNQDHMTEGPFTVQRIWSNARAALGLDPCVPAAAAVSYFNAAPTRSFFALEVGESATFEVDAFSTGPMSDWNLWPYDASGGTTPYLSFSIVGGRETDAGAVISVNNGSKIDVTVTLLRDPGSLPMGVADGWLISYAYDAGHLSSGHYWPVGVTSRAGAADAGIDAAAFGPSRAPGLQRRSIHRRRRGA